jgi:hypothetical protein
VDENRSDALDCSIKSLGLDIAVYFLDRDLSEQESLAANGATELLRDAAFKRNVAPGAMSPELVEMGKLPPVVLGEFPGHIEVAFPVRPVKPSRMAGQLIERPLGVIVSFTLILGLCIATVIGQSVHQFRPGQRIASIGKPPGLDLLDRDPQDEAVVPGYQFANFLLYLMGAAVEKNDIERIIINLIGEGCDQLPHGFEYAAMSPLPNLKDLSNVIRRQRPVKTRPVASDPFQKSGK